LRIIERRPVDHPLMAVSYKLMAEFPGQALKVLQVVANCADNDLKSDPCTVERAARARLTAIAHAPCHRQQEVPLRTAAASRQLVS
jgi:hypothetical protein